MVIFASAMAGEKAFVTGRDAPPIPEPAELDLYAVATLVVFHGFLSLFPPGMHGRFPLSFNALLNQSTS